jgi:hypothetical protein
MRISKIEKMIRDALADESQTGRFRQALTQTAHQRGMELSDENLSGIVQFVEEYISHVPTLMKQAEEAGKALGDLLVRGQRPDTGPPRPSRGI